MLDIQKGVAKRLVKSIRSIRAEISCDNVKITNILLTLLHTVLF